MCKIFDWVFDSITVEEAPQNHFEDLNQDADEGFDQVFDSVEDREAQIRSTIERLEQLLEDETETSQMIIIFVPVSEITEKISKIKIAKHCIINLAACFPWVFHRRVHPYHPYRGEFLF